MWIYRFKPVHFLFSFDQRNTFLNTPEKNFVPFDLRGVKAGLMVNERHKMGIGVYDLRTPDARIRNPAGPEANIQFRFTYGTLFYEYLLLSNRWWDIGVPLEIGIGNYSVKSPDTSLHLGGAKIRAYPTGAAVAIHFKPLRWFSVNGMGGYRYVMQRDMTVNLSHWFYAFGISVNTRHIVDDTRYRFKKRKYRRDMAALPAH
ncbi:MAG: hypothetical protein V4649_03445 [Bacteroidota bacterium]